jgi:hypothetical protein
MTCDFEPKLLQKCLGFGRPGVIEVLTSGAWQVLNAASVIAQERAQKRLLIQNLKTGAVGSTAHSCARFTLHLGLAADPARQRAILQPFVEQARSLGISHDIVDAAQAKLRVRGQGRALFETLIDAILKKIRCVAGSFVWTQPAVRHSLTRKRSRQRSCKRLELIDKFIALVSNPESVVPHRLATASASPPHFCTNL